MRDIFTLAESRGITALTTSMDDLIAWLTDIIDQNGLKAIVLVWDEFFSVLLKRTALRLMNSRNSLNSPTSSRFI